MSRNDRRPGRRCDLGCASWPDSDDYSICPVCGEETTRLVNLMPLDENEAMIRRSEALFEDFYEKHCGRKSQTVDGPLEPTIEQHDRYDELYPGGKPDE
jgi:hypothetical protein